MLSLNRYILVCTHVYEAYIYNQTGHNELRVIAESTSTRLQRATVQMVPVGADMRRVFQNRTNNSE